MPDSLADLVKSRDRERWLSVQWAPADRRPALFALHAFDLEMQHIVAQAREAMLAEIRLAWWREQLEALAAGNTAPAEPLLQALAEHVRPRGVDLAAFADILDGFRPLLGEQELQALPLAAARGQPLFEALMAVMSDHAQLAAGKEAAAAAGSRWALACLWRSGWGRIDARLQRLDPPDFPAAPALALPAPLATLDALAKDDWQRMARGKMLRRVASPVRQWKMAMAALSSA